MKEWENLKQSLKSEEAKFHSYSRRDEETHVFVLNGLDEETKPEEIEKELKQKYIDVTKVYKMRSKRALFLVIIKLNIRVRHLQERIRVVNYSKIIWNRYYNKKLITQCHRCRTMQLPTTMLNQSVSSTLRNYNSLKKKEELPKCIHC